MRLDLFSYFWTNWLQRLKHISRFLLLDRLRSRRIAQTFVFHLLVRLLHHQRSGRGQAPLLQILRGIFWESFFLLFNVIITREFLQNWTYTRIRVRLPGTAIAHSFILASHNDRSCLRQERWDVEFHRLSSWLLRFFLWRQDSLGGDELSLELSSHGNWSVTSAVRSHRVLVGLGWLEAFACWPFLRLELDGCFYVYWYEVNWLLFRLLHLQKFVFHKTLRNLTGWVVSWKFTGRSFWSDNSAPHRIFLFENRLFFQILFLYISQGFFCLSNNFPSFFFRTFRFFFLILDRRQVTLRVQLRIRHGLAVDLFLRCNIIPLIHLAAVRSSDTFIASSCFFKVE